jgi:hypothetical protein
MKLTSIELHPANSSDITILSFRDPSASNAYNVKTITGLDADEISRKFSGGSGSASNFANLAMQRRDVAILLGLNPDYNTNESYSDLRDSLYRSINSSRTGVIQIQFKNGSDIVAVLEGFVSKFEAPQFEKMQEVTITITCNEAMLKAPEAVSLDVEDLDPDLIVITDSLSTAPHGFIIVANLLDDMASFSITDPDDDSWSFEITSGYLFEGSTLYLSSEFNNKYVYADFDLDTNHLADGIMPGSSWPIIFPGGNSFSFSTPTDFEIVSITYYPTYWGV